MTGSFKAEPDAMTAAAKQFHSEVEPINQAAVSAEELRFTDANAGRYYASCGSSYRAAMLTFVQALLQPMATKTTWVADTLTSSATHYSQRDSGNSTTLTNSGSGA